MASDPSSPPSLAIGPYNLDMSIVGLKGLVEIPPAEYKVLPKTFKGEKIFKAPDVSFLGFSWDVRLGVVNGKIYKISTSLMFQREKRMEKVAIKEKILSYCKSKLGEPAEQTDLSIIWDTSDGNVMLQTLATPLHFVINLFCTSSAVKGHELDRDYTEALKTLSNDIVKFQKQQRYMQVMLYKEISEKLLKELTFEPNVTQVLAGQIVNYYSGVDIDEHVKNMEEPNKSSVAKIRQWIIPKAEEILRNSYNLRRLIVYTLRMDIVYKFAMEGEKYLESDEKKRKESILIKFGPEFPEEAKPQLFDKIFSDYFKASSPSFRESFPSS